ncbi:MULTISPECIES: CcdB family protein [Pectobacterium]|uniref:Toxin CcdB n=1 Tax=Pectobacterium aquaticum TaxID=2204145 RepID=A0AA93APZ4_9GAMM|nr:MULTISPECIES: CcdB family protein [Pectobacterium]MDQ5891217.1 toxin CcdB [Pseudomonadota bacterium]PLY38002.1 cytotoxin [Pectobacterium carotovorum]AVT60364.1 putative toxin of gyrase inhibiting toxin-antitoxin system [Pectobacterium versatile]KFX15918.1 cytotoxin [Pectobacterium parvum]MBA0171877.1 CcdB family protein [Pectobacterium versatile]
MQYKVYRNNGNSNSYPYLLNIQSDIIGELHTRLVIPLFPLHKIARPPARRLTPIVTVEGNDYLIMTHEMASVRRSQLGHEVMDAQVYRKTIKDAVDFLLDGF